MNESMHEAPGRQRRLPWRPIGWSAAVALLLLPLVAMRLTAEVRWTLSDFVFAAVLIGGVGGAFELVVRAAPNRSGLAGFAVALAGVFLMIWVNAAVGIIGSADNDANFLYAGLLLVGLVVGAIGGFRPAAMVRAMVAVLLCQALITVTALTLGLGAPLQGAVHLLSVNAFFMAFWLVAAVLFRRAGAQG